MRYVKTLPTEPGLYWCRHKDSKEGELVKLVIKKINRKKLLFEFIEDEDRWWDEEPGIRVTKDRYPNYWWAKVVEPSFPPAKKWLKK